MDSGMNLKLGIVSGEILTLFSEVKDPLCVREIKVYLGEPSDVVLMSLGWLIREGMVNSVIMNEEYFFRPVKEE